MVNRRHQEHKVRLVDDACSFVRSHVKLEACSRIEVGGAGLTGNRAVTVLCNLCATACSNQAGKRTYVKAALAVATGTHNVGEFVAAVGELALLAAEYLRTTGDFVGNRPLAGKCGQDSGHLAFVHNAVGQVFHEHFGSFAAQVLAFGKRVQDPTHIERLATVVEERLEEFVGAAAGNRFRVELHAFNRERLVTNAHDVAVGSTGGHFEIRRERRFVDDQAVVTREDVLLADGAEEPLAVQVDFFGDAVLDKLGLHNLRAEGITDGLVAEAHAENRELARKVLDGFHGDTRIFGAARTRAHNEAARIQLFDVGDGAFAATEHADFFVSDFCQRLIDVVSKRVVVVDNDDHSENPLFNVWRVLKPQRTAGPT